MTTEELINALAIVLEALNSGRLIIKPERRKTGPPSKYKPGHIFKGFVLEEKTGTTCVVRCEVCGEASTHCIQNLVNGTARCDCQKNRFRPGQTIKQKELLRRVEGRRWEVKCLVCGENFVCFQQNWKNGRVQCPTCKQKKAAEASQPIRRSKVDELLQRPKGGQVNNDNASREDKTNVDNIHIRLERPAGTSKAATIRRLKKETTRYGDWDVVAKKGQQWEIQCRNCGHKITRTASYVRSLKVKCACNPDYDPRGRKPNDPDVARVHLSPGTRFGRLFVSEYLGVNDQGEQLYWANCLCGGSINVTRHQLETSAVQSCGCQK